MKLHTLLVIAALSLSACGTSPTMPKGLTLSGSYVHPKTGAVIGISTAADGAVSGSVSYPIKDANGNTVGTVDLTATK